MALDKTVAQQGILLRLLGKKKFTYEAYRGLLALLREQGYAFRNYHNYEDAFRCAILRHDIDNSLDQTVKLAELEVEEVDVGTVPNVIRTQESKRLFFSTIEHFYAREEERPAVGRFTYISPRVKIGKNVRIGHNCTLDGDITIGDGTIIWNNVTIVNRVMIGQNCEVQSGAVVVKDVPPGEIVVGNPARPFRKKE